MGKSHLSSEELSALLDGELTPAVELQARQHLSACPTCSADYSLLHRLETELREPPVISCEAALEPLSAAFDAQAGEADQALTRRHLNACGPCRDRVDTWRVIAPALHALPAGAPSARVDRAIAALVRPKRGLRPALPGLAARTAIAGAAVVAIVVSALGRTGPTPIPALQSDQTERVIVAAAQQIVFNSKNNTLYVLDSPNAAVEAREPETNELKVRIPIGGEPTRLTLNEFANTILVLDAKQKRVTEIDAESNTVISATTVDMAGTPTSINVDSAGKILVTAEAAQPSAAPAGAVAVIDGATKQVEVVRVIDVAPRIIVPDPAGTRAALVSAHKTTLVDASYNVIATLPGGVGAAFSRRSDVVAILSVAGDGAVVSFSGGAPTLRLQGAPRAITAMRDGGYLVLLDVKGQGRVVKVNQDGQAEGSVDVAISGADLLYDEVTNLLTVANGGTVASARVPTGEAARASPTAAATSTSAPASVSPSPSISSSPTPTASAAGGTTAGTSNAQSILAAARPIDADLYSLQLPNGVKPHLMAASGSRIWFVDDANTVRSLDSRTGELRTIGALRADAHVGYWVAGASYVYGVDPATGQVHLVNTARETVDSYATNVLSRVSAVAVAPDDRLWIALRDLSYLLAWDPKSRQMNTYDLAGARVSALTVDAAGRVHYADDVNGTVGTLDPSTSVLSEFIVTRRGMTTAVVVDGAGTLWLGTNTGDIYSLRAGAVRLVLNVRMPVTSLALDHTGRAWYLAPIPNGSSGFAYGPVDGTQAVRSIPGPAAGLAFGASGRAFSADPRGAFYIGGTE